MDAKLSLLGVRFWSTLRPATTRTPIFVFWPVFKLLFFEPPPSAMLFSFKDTAHFFIAAIGEPDGTVGFVADGTEGTPGAVGVLSFANLFDVGDMLTCSWNG